MKLWLLLALAQAPQAPVAPPQAPPAAEARTEAKLEPFAGTLRAGRLELAQLAKQEHHEEARLLGERLLAKPDFELAPETERAETLYAIGVAAGLADDIERAVESFHRSRGLAGSSELGRDAAYNAGTHLLRGAEALRLQIPEIREKLELPPLPQPAQPPFAPSGAGQAPKAPDALAIAREAYVVSRGELATCWREAPGDADVRANLELVQRRLRELDELQRQREEEQQQQEQQKQDPNSQKNPGDDSQSKPDDKQDPSKDPQQDPQKPQDSQDPSKDPQQPKKPEDQPKQDSQQQDAQPDKAREEMLMTPEEMQRLLDQLKSIEDQARQVEALLRERRRTPVKKDW